MTVGLVSGFGTRAGMYVLNRVYAAAQASVDSDWPEINFINVAPDFDKFGNVTEITIKQLKKAVDNLKLIGSTRIYVACNTVHAFFDQWANDCCVNWTQTFANTIPLDYPVIGSTITGQHQLYGAIVSADDTTNLINCYIGNKTPQSTRQAKVLWNMLQEKHQKLALCCTELSLAYAEFGATIPIIDCCEFLIAQIQKDLE